MERWRETWGHWKDKSDRISAAWGLMKWVILGSVVGLLSGTASALFLVGLELAASLREQMPWLMFLLPAGGALVSFMYWKFGKNSVRGNNLILEQIHDGTEPIPLRMAPLVLAGTWITHLFGGSAGREGTAVQMAGSLSDWLARLLRIGAADRTLLLLCGVGGGFGSVFGTPLAGTVFALEVAAIGLLRQEALIPCFTASLTAHLVTTKLWGVSHAHYAMGAVPPLEWLTVVKVVFASVLFGLMSSVFSELTHALKRRFTAWLPNPVWKSAVGGILVIVLVYAVGTREYLGLGLPLLTTAFTDTVPAAGFLWKTIFTSLTLGTGFQGGEVTPLFVIGATMGHTLAGLLHLPAPFLAGLGLIAVFSGAANTPVACFLMGLELFGADGALYMFMASAISYLFSGHTGIYTSQRIGVPKLGVTRWVEGATLANWKQRK